MTTTDSLVSRHVKFRKIDTIDDFQAVATYEVLVDGEVLGTVTKYQMRTWKTQKNGRLRHRTETYWSATRANGHQSQIGYDLRAQALIEIPGAH